MKVQLKEVLLRDDSLTPEEILMSESQERMMAIVPKKHLRAFKKIVEKHEVEYSVLGKVIKEDRLYINWGKEEIVNVPPRTVAHDGPVYERPVAKPSWQDSLNANSVHANGLYRANDSSSELASQLIQIISSPNQASKSWITDQYDRYVGGNTALAQPDDSGMIRVSEETGLGVALATDANGRFCQLDPYQGAKLALAEAYRNVAVSGAKPLAVTNCLNFGSPENPEVMWQFKQATAGLADGCLELGIPVTGGNVSFYNQTGDTAIYPTPVVGVLGVIDDVARRIPSGWQDDGNNIYLLGTTRDELDGLLRLISKPKKDSRNYCREQVFRVYWLPPMIYLRQVWRRLLLKAVSGSTWVPEFGLTKSAKETQLIEPLLSSLNQPHE
jgi:phosphoribosylformylglycinamidine synthase